MDTMRSGPDARAQRDPIERAQRLRGGKTWLGGQETHFRRKVIQNRLSGPFVEIPRPDCRHLLQLFIKPPDMRDLLTSRCRQQPQMHSHHPQRPDMGIKFDTDRPARFKPGQFVMSGPPDRKALAAPDHRVAMPAQTAGTAQIDDLPPGFIQHEMRQGRRARRQTFVGLLQHNDIGLHMFDDLQNALRLAPKIQPEAFLNVIAGNSKGGR